MRIYKKYCLKFRSTQGKFHFLLFFLFFFAIYKIVDSEYNVDIYKSVNISIGTVTKNPEMLKFVLDHFKAKKICKPAVKILPFITGYVPDQ